MDMSDDDVKKQAAGACQMASATAHFMMTVNGHVRDKM